jgi:hypothetical protein
MTDLQITSMGKKFASVNVGPWHFYADRSYEDKQLKKNTSRKNKSTNMAGSLNLKFQFWCMEITHGPLHLDKRSSVQWKIMDIATSYIWVSIFFDEVSNLAMVGFSSSWGIRKNFTNQRETMKFLMLTNLKEMNNFKTTTFAKKQTKIRTCRRMIKFTYYFMKTTHEPSHLEE